MRVHCTLPCRTWQDIFTYPTEQNSKGFQGLKVLHSSLDPIISKNNTTYGILFLQFMLYALIFLRFGILDSFGRKNNEVGP